MHDLDYRSMELTAEPFGVAAEGAVLSEAETQELAAELLSVTQEAELNQFIGDLMNKAAGAAGKVVSAPLGQQLGGLLKGAAKKALPAGVHALGAALGPDGGALAHHLAQRAGAIFGLETEGLSQEDREFEVAKQFVRFAADATRAATSKPPSSHAAQVAREAVSNAAQQHAPGLLETTRPPSAASSGRWVRQGRTIIIYGA